MVNYSVKRLEEAYKIKDFEEKYKAIGDVFDYLKKNNFPSADKEFYKYLSEHPEIANNSTVLNHVAEVLPNKPGIAKEAFEIIKMCTDRYPSSVNGKLYDSLVQILKAEPMLLKDGLDVFYRMTQGDNERYFVEKADEALLDIARHQPGAVKYIRDTFFEKRNDVVSRRSNAHRYMNYDIFFMNAVNERNAEDILDIAREDIKDSQVLCLVDRVIGVRPDLSEEVLDITEEHFVSCENDSKISGNVYAILGDIVLNRQEKAKEMFAIFEDTIMSDRNDGDSLEVAYKTLEVIVEKCPRLAEDVKKVFARALTSDKNNKKSLEKAYKAFGSIVEKESEEKTDTESRLSQTEEKLKASEKRNSEALAKIASLNRKIEETQDRLQKERIKAQEGRQETLGKLNSSEAELWRTQTSLKDTQKKANELQVDLESTKRQLDDKQQIETMFLEGKGISELSTEDRKALFERSDKLRQDKPVMQEISLTTMCRVYVAESDKKEKLEFLKALYQIRKGGKTNKENRDMAKVFERVLDKAPELKKDKNLVALSKVDTGISNPTKQVKKQVGGRD